MVQLALRSLLLKEVGCPRVASPTVPLPVCRKFISFAASTAAAEISNSITALARGEPSGGSDGSARAIAEIKPSKIVTSVTSWLEGESSGRRIEKEFLADKTICQAGVDLDISVSQSVWFHLPLSYPQPELSPRASATAPFRSTVTHGVETESQKAIATHEGQKLMSLTRGLTFPNCTNY